MTPLWSWVIWPGRIVLALFTGPVIYQTQDSTTHSVIEIGWTEGIDRALNFTYKGLHAKIPYLLINLIWKTHENQDPGYAQGG